jgi:hypothetical protein
MSTYTLTRFLYIKDEVELSLVTALLKKKNLQECYYWAFELYYSGFDTELFQLLWKIYFDFYYEYNPIMEMYIIKKQSLWSSGDKNIIHIASILRNLFRLKSSPNTFILRHFMKCDIIPTVIYKTQKHKWLSDYPLKFHKLLLALSNGHLENTCYSIKVLLPDEHVTVNTLRQLILLYVKQNFTEIELDAFEKKWALRSYTNDLHYLLALICQLQIPLCNLNKCNIFVTPKVDDVEFINKVENEPIPIIQKRGFDIEQTYNTLCFKRYFKISETIGAFNLSRWLCSLNYDVFLKTNWFHWEYYAANGCPLWRERLEKCHGVLDHVKETILFPNDNDNDNDKDNDKDKEQFYNLYAYEFDELPKEIQMMSHCDIRPRKWQDWYFDIFVDNDPESLVGIFKDDFTFMEY